MPLTYLGTVVEVYGPSPDTARWDLESWGDPAPGWDTPGWRNVTGLALQAEVEWGADRQVGALSVCAAGRWTARSYDPLRLLDPSNVESPLFSVLRPGTPVRLRYGATVIRTGWLDTIAYSHADRTGDLRASDAIPLLVQARVKPPTSGVPTTLRALAAWLVARVQVPITVETDATADLLVNGSFEAGLAGWSNVGGGAGTGAIPAPAFPGPLDGPNCATVIGGAGYPKVIATNLTAVPGATYRLTGYTALRGARFGSIGLSIRNASGGQVGGAPMVAGTSTDGSWDYVDVSYTVPTDGSVATLQVDLRINSGTTAATDQPLFDGIHLYGPDVANALPPDPPVGPPPDLAADGSVGVWDWLLQASADSLRACYVDALNVLRFRAYGDPRDLGLVIGGAAGIPIEDLAPTASLDAVWNVISAQDSVTTATTEVRDLDSVNRYGERRLDRDRLTPNAPAWVANVLADRSEASLDHSPRLLRVRDLADLTALAAAGMGDAVRVLVDSADPPVSAAATLLGLTLRVTPQDGWSGDVVCYVPATGWDDYTPPPLPPNPLPPPLQTVTRSYTCAKDARLALTSSGGQYGSGTEAQVPVGAWSGWKNRAVLDFQAIPWAGVVEVVSATLRLTTSSQVNVGFGSSPRVEARRITASWSEGSAGSPSGSNAVTWPGPATTTTGATQANVSKSQGARIALDVSAIVRAWAPTAAGGSGQAQRGIALYSASESDASRTTEFLSRETGSSGSRPVLDVVVKVPA